MFSTGGVENENENLGILFLGVPELGLINLSYGPLHLCIVEVWLISARRACTERSAEPAFSRFSESPKYRRADAPRCRGEGLALKLISATGRSIFVVREEQKY